jgi:AAA+ superfamily predicted ATPase
LLESYEGIVILTSSRVKTLDEAFKSRIQASIHYADLNTFSRRKIWQNLFDMLRADEEDVHFEDLAQHMEELAEHQMNGRQIRNTLTTARQMAIYRRQTLEWDHLQQAITVESDFNRCFQKLHSHSVDQ